MSKCQSEFAAYCINEGITSQQYSDEILPVWRAAWNIRGKVDAEICQQYDYARFADECAEAIEQEDEK